MATAATTRIAIVGASSIAGKELNDAMSDSPLAAGRITLLDDEGVAGRLAAAGDDISIVQTVDADSFEGADFVFFAGPAAQTLRYWRAAQQAGAGIVDLTGALEMEPDVIVRAPWVLASEGPDAGGNARSRMDLTTQVVVSAHPAAMMLVATAARLGGRVEVRSIAATVFEPASAHGQAAMDELHQQTVSLLSFQTMPREQFDAQSAFNLLPALGESTQLNLEDTRTRIAREYATLKPERGAELALQIAQAPVFHGTVVSALVELAEPASVARVETALRGGAVDVPGAGSEAPSNVSAAGQSQIVVRVTSAAQAAGGRAESTRFWLWMAADNLKLAALNAIGCAGELRRVRPQGQVQ